MAENNTSERRNAFQDGAERFNSPVRKAFGVGTLALIAFGVASLAAQIKWWGK